MPLLIRLTLHGRGITGGVAEGEAMVTSEPLGFSHGLDPQTGLVSDTAHPWFGQSVSGKVLVFPYGKGSSTGGLYILEATKRGNAPAAVVNVETDPVAAGGFIMAKMIYGKDIPVVDRLDQNPVEVIKTGDRVRVDAANGIVEIG
jgi:uncharacterized protein